MSTVKDVPKRSMFVQKNIHMGTKLYLMFWGPYILKYMNHIIWGYIALFRFLIELRKGIQYCIYKSLKQMCCTIQLYSKGMYQQIYFTPKLCKSTEGESMFIITSNHKEKSTRNRSQPFETL